MKKLLCVPISMAMLLMASPLLAQNLQWQVTNGPWGGPISSLARIGSLLFTSSSNGRLFESTDDGSTWNQLAITKGDTSLASLSCVGTMLFSSSSAGVPGTVRSFDSGKTWTPYTGPWRPIVGNDTALFACKDYYVYRSYDSGATWTQLSPTVSGAITPCVLGRTIVVENNWPNEYGGTFRSTDDGDTWHLIDTSLNLQSIQALCPIGTILLAATSDSELFRSTDSGASWNPVLPGPQFQLSELISDSGILFAGSYTQGVFRSTDSGANWEPVDSGITNRSAYSFLAYNGNVFVGTEDGIFRSTDSGNLWRESDSGLNGRTIRSLQLDGNILYALMDNRVFRTDDAGTSWKLIDGGIPHALPMLSIVPGSLYLFEYDSLYRSTDSGLSWSSLNWPAWCGPFSLLGTSSGAFVGTACNILRSTDFGLTWDSVFTFGQGFEDGAVGLIASDSFMVALDWDPSGLIVSTNFGNLWTSQDAIHQVGGFLMDGHTVFISTEWGLYKSYDAVQWDSVADWNSVNNQGSFYSLAASGPLLLAGSATQGIHASMDSGYTWFPVKSNSSDVTYSPAAIGSAYIFAKGSDGQIYRTSLASLGVGSYTERPELSVRTYPNPIYATANIDYAIPTSEPVSMLILDPLGRIVSKPINGETQESGQHEITIDASTLASGIYFCRLNAGGVIQQTQFVVER